MRALFELGDLFADYGGVAGVGDEFQVGAEQLGGFGELLLLHQDEAEDVVQARYFAFLINTESGAGGVFGDVDAV